MNKTRQALLYILIDLTLSFGVWLLFFVLRRNAFEYHSGPLADKKFYDQIIPAVVIGVYWVIMYGLSGAYVEPYRKSRLKELNQVFKYSLFGVLVIFFIIFLDDARPKDTSLKFYLMYFFIQLISIAISHFTLSSITNYRLRHRKIGFPTLIIGSGERADSIVKELNSSRRSFGFDIRGFLDLPDAKLNQFYGKLKHFGNTSRIKEVITSRKIEEVIIAVDGENKSVVKGIIDKVAATGAYIKVVPEIYDYVVGSVKITHILGAPLIEISPDILSTWEKALKRGFDITASMAVLTLFSPLYLLLAIIVKLDSKGPIYYRQERIGKGGAPFFIIKYRSMKVDAEKAGPALSSDHDPRITRVGKFLRKSRLDEIPQFWNVLRGDMSIVGPRPERQFYIDKITEQAPHYIHLHKVRPGITSWGMIKYGYAENVEQMVERMKFDILYIENMSLLLDIKIMIYTVIVMVEGRGK